MEEPLTIKIKENETLYNLKFSLESNSLVINVSEDESVLDNKIKIQKSKGVVILTLSLPIGVVKEVNLTIPQAKVDTEQVIAGLCSTVNELKKKVKFLESKIITEEQLNKNLKSKDILISEE